MRAYFRRDFLIDLAGALLEFGQNNMFSLIFMLSQLVVKKTQIYQLIEKLDYRNQIQQRYPSASNLVKLVAMIFALAHYLASCFYNLSADNAQISDHQNWIQAKDLQDKPPFEIYINSLYFTFITMITVGFGGNASTTRSMAEFSQQGEGANLSHLRCLCLRATTRVRTSPTVLGSKVKPFCFFCPKALWP